MPIQGFGARKIVSSPEAESIEPVNYFIDKKAYVAGGVVFAFPAGLFVGGVGNGPWMNIGIEAKALLFLPTFAVTHFIDELDAAHTRVRVVKADLLAIVEVLTDDVTVHLHAWGL